MEFENNPTIVSSDITVMPTKPINPARIVIAIILCLLSMGGIAFGTYELNDGEYAYYKAELEEYEETISTVIKMRSGGHFVGYLNAALPVLTSKRDSVKRRYKEERNYIIAYYSVSGAALVLGIILIIVDIEKRKKVKKDKIAMMIALNDLDNT